MKFNKNVLDLVKQRNSYKKKKEVTNIFFITIGTNCKEIDHMKLLKFVLDEAKSQTTTSKDDR